MRSKKFTISIRDGIHGLITAAFAAPAAAILDCVNKGSLPTIPDIKQYGYVALVAGVGYIVKQYLSNSEGKIKKEPKNPIV